MSMTNRVVAAAGVLLLLPFAHARAADATRYYTICGGSYAGWNGFGLCASVAVNVATATNGATYVTLTVFNTSGNAGSYAGSVFTAVGLDNVIPPSINTVAGTLRVTGPCAADPSKSCDYSSNWQLADNKQIGGGINVDLLDFTTNGVNYAIASQCGVNAQQTPGTPLIVTGCSGTGTNYAVLQFQVSSFFDPNSTGDVFIKAQNGYGGASTTCDTGLAGCVTVTPEPNTIVLLGSGLLGIGGFTIIRRRKRGDSSPDV